MGKTIKNIYVISILALLMGSCVVGGKYQQPTTSLPTEFGNGVITDTTPLVKWFDLFEDTALKSIIKITLQNNKNLLLAGSRVEEASIQTDIIRLNSFPVIGYDVQAGAGTAKTEARKLGSLNTGLFKAGAFLSWELDIWGKLKHSTESARAQFLATSENRTALQVSLVAEAASLYFLLRDLDNRLVIAKRTLVSRKENTKIINQRVEKGYTADLDRLQAVQQESIAAAFIPNIQRQIIQTENALNVLMGQNPGPIPRGASIVEQAISTVIPVGLPSQLLQRRPDLRVAEQLLRAQYERMGIAEASRYPSFSLTGLLGFASPQLGSLLSNGFTATGIAGLTGPIFQFGQNKKRVEVEKKRVIQIQYQYEQSLLQALADVNNSLTQNLTFTEEYNQRKLQVEAARQALLLSKARYDYGYTSYLEVLVQESSLFDAELQESILLQQRLNAVVSLYRALGGGW